MINKIATKTDILTLSLILLPSTVSISSMKTVSYERVKAHIALNTFQMTRAINTAIVIIVLSAVLILASTSIGAQQHLVFASSGQITAGSIVKGDIKNANMTAGKIEKQSITNAQLKAANITGATIMKADITMTKQQPAKLKSAAGKSSAGNATVSQLKQGQITAGQITAGNMTQGQVTGGQVKGGNITGATVTGADLTSASVKAASITGANVTAGSNQNAAKQGNPLTKVPVIGKLFGGKW